MCILLVIVTSVVLKIPMFFQFKIVTIAGAQQYWTTSIMDSTTYLTFISVPIAFTFKIEVGIKTEEEGAFAVEGNIEVLGDEEVEADTWSCCRKFTHS